jgi:hypothetical protein
MKAEQHIRTAFGPADPARDTTVAPPPVTPTQLITRAETSAGESPHRQLPRRRLMLLGGAAAAAAAIVVAGGLRDAEAPATSAGDNSTTEASISGQNILLAAATTAEKTSLGSGAYWYTKVASTGSRSGESFQEETWTTRDGRAWSRSSYQHPAAASATPSAFPPGHQDGKVVEVRQPNPFSLGGAKVTIEQLEALPAEATAIKARIAELVDSGDIRTSAGKLTTTQKQQFVFEGLVSLVSLLPAPPNVRAAALRAIASYPNVETLGATEGGRGLLISFYPGEPPALLVIDPRTGQLRQTNVLVLTHGGTMTSDAGTFAVTSEWTDTLPR